MRRLTRAAPVVLAALALPLVQAAPASAAYSTLVVAGHCVAAYDSTLDADGLTAWMRTGPAGCQLRISANCETYTGETLQTQAGPITPDARVRLRGKPNAGDLTNCTVYFSVTDPTSGDNNYATRYYRTG
jgi:hypothetical protein